MSEPKKQLKKGEKHYKKFQKARLEESMLDWLDKEKKRFQSWNLFFREIKKRYETESDNL